MPTIRILDDITADQIAAGEVVERPASVVKELVENSLDAGASVISVSILNGGIHTIEVTDNGSGMDPDDVRLAFLRHATSKLTSVDDFSRITTMGFRGEALASIASVSRVTLTSRRILAENGYTVTLDGGKTVRESAAGCREGTGVTVESLFYNTPARYKFLKKDSVEASYITDIMERFILARPDVSFRLHADREEILHSPGNNDLRSAIFAVYGKEIAGAVLPVDYQDGTIRITGFAGKPEISRKTRQHQTFFVNHRYIRSSAIASAVEEAYKTLLMKGRFAFCVLDIELSPALVDVNVHPQKTTVKFWNEGDMFRAVYHAVHDALDNKITIPGVSLQAGGIRPDAPAVLPVASTGQPDVLQADDTAELPVKGPGAGSLSSAGGASGPDVRQLEEPREGYRMQAVLQEPHASREQKAADLPAAVSAAASGEIGEEGLLFASLRNRRYAGTLFNTYLLFESGDDLILVDQHAAHERILFEELYASWKEKKIRPQILLQPEIIEFSPSEMQIVRERSEWLQSLGFECEPFGTRSILLRTVPAGSADGRGNAGNALHPSAALRSVVDELSASAPSSENIPVSDILYTMACKAAVKAHDRLKPEEIDALVQRLSLAGRNTHCPHGRPVAVKVARSEIEKWFKRIVS